MQLLKKIKEKYITINHEIFKVYSQGLFSPLLYYIIQYMNENSYNKNKDTKLLIGKTKINNLGVLYSVLNEKIYDLFSKSIKDVAYDDKIELIIIIKKKMKRKLIILKILEKKN